MKSIMHLVNGELVLCEAMELARYGLAQNLGVDVEQVQLSVQIEGDNIRPEFSVDASVLKHMTEDGVRKNMAKVWLPVKRQMQTRLKGLVVRR